MNNIKAFFKIIYRNKQAFIGMLILLGFIMMATVGAAIMPLDLNPNYENRYRPPALIEMIFGTDKGKANNAETEIGRNPFQDPNEVKKT